MMIVFQCLDTICSDVRNIDYSERDQELKKKAIGSKYPKGALDRRLLDCHKKNCPVHIKIGKYRLLKQRRNNECFF